MPKRHTGCSSSDRVKRTFLVLPPESQRAAAARSPMVAERPILRGGQRRSRSRRTSWQRICRPRSVPIKECTSSITTNRRSPKSLGRSFCRLMSILSKLSGVICRIPLGSFRALALWEEETSPCQWVRGMLPAARSSESRSNWSLIKLFRGAMYSTPKLPGGSLRSSEMMGKKAASVFPEAVEEQMRRWSAESKMAVAASS